MTIGGSGCGLMSLVVIENHRTRLIWDLFMSCSELAPMMQAIGWRREP